MIYNIKVTYGQVIGQSEFKEEFNCGNFENEEDMIAFAELCKMHVKDFKGAIMSSDGSIEAEE